ncbi:hypothetical protein DSM14862_02731 [Sulfitobacter indolifex]|uniref:Uncharacterized protein n=1 Tax=Sulfitobacter indolifex HEL-45 TaxID=391624 RepID=A0ABP2DBU4_9RHOB|nr:hypothetical protein [Sulfitobacter indolifex]EDQ05747.1 hypothetical protein OIHEL45_03015 [Sulfitobacter indolifex HEL-45]UOA19917.1 hypothetical protein DSM14862_02731 [Sulfitobacter indolifex]
MKNSLITIFLFMAAATAGSAQNLSICMPTAELESGLVDWHNETLASQQGEDTYVWASGIGGSWTLVQYKDDVGGEVACVLEHGENWTPNIGENVLLANAVTHEKPKLF